MERNFWFNRWKNNEIAFHQSEVESNLVKYFEVHADQSVLVPFCGKSKDLLWLAQKNKNVIGAELSPLACEHFFQENKLEYSIEQKGDFSVYTAENISIWCGDFFSLPHDLLATNRPQRWAIYDRAAMIALPPSMRSGYATKLLNLIRAAPRSDPTLLLLITLEYPQDRLEGPPFSIAESEVRTAYASARSIILLAREHDQPSDLVGTKFEGLTRAEVVYRIEL